MRTSIIVAVAGDKQVIGSNGNIPWKLPGDLKRFKALTMGHCLIMGRKTHISIGKPLPGRTTIVMSRGNAMVPFAPTVYVASSLGDALKHAIHEEDTEAFICGGGQIYELAMPMCDRIYRTVIERPIAGDVFFPKIDESEWKCIETTHVENEALPHRFEIWERR